MKGWLAGWLCCVRGGRGKGWAGGHSKGLLGLGEKDECVYYYRDVRGPRDAKKGRGNDNDNDNDNDNKCNASLMGSGRWMAIEAKRQQTRPHPQQK